MSFVHSIVLFFAFLAWLLAFLFFIRKNGDRYSNALLGLFLVFFGYNLLFNVFYWSDYEPSFMAMVAFTDDIPLAFYGFLFFAYVRRVVAGIKINVKDIIHLPLLLFVFYQYGGHYFLSFSEKLAAYENGNMYENVNVIPGAVFILIAAMTAYLILGYVWYVKHYHEDPFKRKWLQLMTLFFALFVLSWITFYTLYEFYIVPEGLDYFISFFMILQVGLIAYFAFMHAKIFDTPVSASAIFPFFKYQRTGLSKEYSEELKLRLVELMDTEKPYLDSDLRLGDLANMLDIPRHHASQIVNEHFSSNFFDFINQYRIKEAEQYLSEKNSRLTIQKIAYQSGFNSRSSFYKAFKKLTGITPKEYRDHNLAS